MWKGSCTCNPNHFVVFPPEVEEYSDGLGILVEPSGEVTNRFADGTVGVPADIVKSAEDCESAACPMCGKEASWVH